MHSKWCLKRSAAEHSGYWWTKETVKGAEEGFLIAYVPPTQSSFGFLECFLGFEVITLTFERRNHSFFFFFPLFVSQGVECLGETFSAALGWAVYQLYPNGGCGICLHEELQSFLKASLPSYCIWLQLKAGKWVNMIHMLLNLTVRQL